LQQEFFMPSKEPSQNRPRSLEHAPDPAISYERAKDDREASAGSSGLSDPDDMNTGASNAQPTDRQLNSQDEPTGKTAPAQPLNQIDLSKPAKRGGKRRTAR
jgi:hypothetical protein